MSWRPLKPGRCVGSEDEDVSGTTRLATPYEATEQTSRFLPEFGLKP